MKEEVKETLRENSETSLEQPETPLNESIPQDFIVVQQSKKSKQASRIFKPEGSLKIASL